MANFNSQVQNMSASASQCLPSQLNVNGQSPFGGDRGDFASRETDADDSTNVMMRMLLGDPDGPVDHSGTGRPAPGQMHDNVANMTIPSAQTGLSLVQSWIQEAIPGQEGDLIARRFRNEVKGLGYRV